MALRNPAVANKKRVVIIGSGFGGADTAMALDKNKKIKVSLVERRDASVNKLGALRAAAADDVWTKRVFVPTKNMLKNGGEVIKGNVTRVSPEEKKVYLEDGDFLEYDYLVCATGARHSVEPPASAQTVEEMTNFFNDWKENVLAANSIVICGSGPVAVEFAGEVQHYQPGKKITLVSDGNQLINNAPTKLSNSFRRKLLKEITSKGVEVIFNDRVNVEFPEDKPYVAGKQTITTRNGKEIETDLVVKTFGVTPNNSMYPGDWLDDKGLLKVNESLQCLSDPTVFAVGDITNVQETKLAFIAGMHAKVVAKNVGLSVNGKTSLKKHKPMSSGIMLVPFGPNGGKSNVYSFSVSFLTKVKGGDLLAKKVWKQRNSVMPIE